jgi:hypothetical protein
MFPVAPGLVRLGACSCGAVLVVLAAAPAAAQIDPLAFLKVTQPNVLLLVDTAPRMLVGAGGDYFDPHEYEGLSPGDLALNPAGGPYRRRYRDLRFASAVDTSLITASIAAVRPSDPEYAGFHNRTRIGIAKRAIARAVHDNGRSARFGLLTMRQAGQALPSDPNGGPVASQAADQQGTGDLADGRWAITVPTVDRENRLNGSLPPLVMADDPGANAEVRAIAERTWSQLRLGPALLPAGRDTATVSDAPLAALLEDARQEAARLIADDDECRNTVAVLIAGGGEGTGRSPDDAAALAATFTALGGRRVPVHVLAILPSDEERVELRAIARASGGEYVEVRAEDVESTAATGYLEAVPAAVRAIDAAVQHAFALPSDVNRPPTPSAPLGGTSEFQATGPVIATVNLQGASYASGERIDDHEVRSATGSLLRQASNVMVTAGFVLPGFEGRLRAFRVYRPEVDPTRGTGVTFVADGRALWVARTPDPAARNIFTVLPNGEVASFSPANAARLAPYLATFDPLGLIEFVRAHPLGAIVSSTPAVLGPPSAGWPPDGDYPPFVARHEGRRALVFVGANDGMLHAFDARSGLEVWAVIPFNLLPRLQALRDGQGLDRFGYFVDASPRLADVRVDHDGDGRTEWRTHLYVGQGAGGTFYQAFDVTLDGMAAAGVTATAEESAVLSYFADPSRIRFAWAFPRYSAFDYRLLDHEAGVFGDVSAAAPFAATDLELSVGQTWSTPVVARPGSGTASYGVLTGSGFFPYSREQVSWRKHGAVRAGTTFYVLDAATGMPLDTVQVPADGLAEAVDDCGAVSDCRHQRNALQADAVGIGRAPATFITGVYVGDLDGHVWRIDVTAEAGVPRIRGTTQVYSAGPTHPLFGAIALVEVDGVRHLFFGSGSDLLPAGREGTSHRLFGVVDGGTGAGFQHDLAGGRTGGSGERVTSAPAIAGDIVYFTTTTREADGVCASPDVHLYAFTFSGGAAYDATGDGRVSEGESPRVLVLAGAGRATAPFVVDRHLYFGAGTRVAVLGDREKFNAAVGEPGLRILSWRRVR